MSILSINDPIKTTRCSRHANDMSQEVMAKLKSYAADQPKYTLWRAFCASLYNTTKASYQLYMGKAEQLGETKIKKERTRLYSELKELKKQACESISLYRNGNSKKIEILEEEINSSYFSRALSFFCKFSLFNDIFRSSSSKVDRVCENLNRQHQLKSLDCDLLKAQNEILEKHAEITGQWRPDKSEVTKQFLIERMKSPEIEQTLQTAIDMYCDVTGNDLSIDSIMKKLKSVKFNEFGLSEKGLIKLNSDIDFIVTSKNNYYLVFKNMKIGEGSFKTVYSGLDLTKNRPIALGYVEGRKDAQHILSKEEDTYCKITGKDLHKNNEISNKQNVIKYIDCFEFEDKCILVSDLYSCSLKDHIKSKEMEPDEKISLCGEAINLILELSKKSINFMDLKVSNFLIDKGHLRLCDLDIKAFSPEYFPPEISIKFNAEKFNVKKNYKEPQVVWALGLVLFHTFFREGMSNKLGEFLEQGHPTDMPLFFASLRPTLKPLEIQFISIIERMLCVNPENRPTLEQIQRAWENKMVSAKLVPERSAHSDEQSVTDLSLPEKGQDSRLERQSDEAGSQYIHFSETLLRE